MNPKISVTMPCYNCEKTVAKAVESILSQDYDNYELIAVDDGSTDSTASILKNYQKLHPELIKVILAEHQGVVGAANIAISNASGEFIARMDSDDFSLPLRLSTQAKFLIDNPDIGLTACRVDFGGDRSSAGGYAHYVDWINSVILEADISLKRFVEFPFANPSIMVRKSVLEKYGLFRDGDFPEDYELILRLLHNGVKMQKVDEELFVWNDPPQRISRNHSKYSVDAFYRVKSEYLCKWLIDNQKISLPIGIVGSGRTSRKRFRFLQELGVNPSFYIDVDPKKIGQVIHGCKVIDRSELPPAGECFLLSYLGGWGAREDLEYFLDSKKYVAGENYILVS